MSNQEGEDKGDIKMNTTMKITTDKIIEGDSKDMKMMIIIINSPEGDNKREESQESKGSKEKQDSQEKKAILIVGKNKSQRLQEGREEIEGLEPINFF